MIGMIGGLARALAILIAIVAAFVTIPNVNVALILVILGLIGGLVYTEETATRLILTVLVLPAVGMALSTIPQIGENLAAIASNLLLATAGATATMLAIRLFGLVKGDLTGLGGGKKAA